MWEIAQKQANLMIPTATNVALVARRPSVPQYEVRRGGMYINQTRGLKQLTAKMSIENGFNVSMAFQLRYSNQHPLVGSDILQWQILHTITQESETSQMLDYDLSSLIEHGVKRPLYLVVMAEADANNNWPQGFGGACCRILSLDYVVADK